MTRCELEQFFAPLYADALDYHVIVAGTPLDAITIRFGVSKQLAAWQLKNSGYLPPASHSELDLYTQQNIGSIESTRADSEF